MAAAIEFYFDFSSPYGYLAARRIDAVAEEYGREVAWKPFLLGALFKTTGSQPLRCAVMHSSWRRRSPRHSSKGSMARQTMRREACCARWQVNGAPLRSYSTTPLMQAA